MSPDVEYLNATIWAELRPSKVHGIGVFAIRPIPIGTRITNYSVHTQFSRRCCLHVGDFDLLHPAIQRMILSRTSFPVGTVNFRFVCPNTEQTLQSFINHSSTPNFYEGTAVRDIAENEELLEDYRVLNQGETMHQISKQHWAFLLEQPGAINERRLIESFLAVDSLGRTYAMLVWDDGKTKTIETADGQQVVRLKQGQYRLAESGIEVSSGAANAP